MRLTWNGVPSKRIPFLHCSAFVLSLIVSGVVLLGSASFAWATTFDYSYTFGDGWKVTGSFKGDQNGLYVTNISNISLAFVCQLPCSGPYTSAPDGLPVHANAWNYETHFWDKTIAPTVSFDGTLNNFQFINQPNYPHDFDSATLRYFAMLTIDPLYPYDLPPVSGQDSTVFRGDGERTINGSAWKLTAVPEPPDCSKAKASPDVIWSPKHQFVPIAILGVIDQENKPITLTFLGVRQDEPVQGYGSGNTSPDAMILNQGLSASVRAERDGNGDGRVYHLVFQADNGQGTCTGVVKVGVPHSMQVGLDATDEGPIFDSTVP